ncbi:hypothetical protein ACT533_07285, partial [Leptospira santarosai]
MTKYPVSNCFRISKTEKYSQHEGDLKREFRSYQLLHLIMLYSKDLLEADSSSFSAKKEKSFKNTDGISEQDSDDRTKRYSEEFISLSIHKCA